jgi:hypothetical protein
MGESERDSQNGEGRMGQAEQEIPNETGEQERQNRKDRTGQAEEQDFLLYRFEDYMFCDSFAVTNMFSDMYCFETVLLCDMYR